MDLIPTKGLPEYLGTPLQEIVLRGDILNGVTYESHTFTLFVFAKHQGLGAQRIPTAPLYLQVQHSGGKQLFWLLDHRLSTQIDEFLTLPPVMLYTVLHSTYSAHATAYHRGYESCWNEITAAVTEGRLKRRKVRGHNPVRVSIVQPLRASA